MNSNTVELESNFNEIKYMENEEQTLNTNPETESLSAPAAEGEENVEVAQTATPALTLEEINQLTGHRYQSVEDARKGLDNLKRAVGKKEIVKEVVDPNLKQEVEILKAQVRDATFYTENPELKPHKEIIAKFGDPYQAIKDPVVQKVLDAVKAREETEDLKSSPRIASTNSDYAADMKKAKETGNWSEFMAKHKGIALK